MLGRTPWYRAAFNALHLELHLLQAGCVRWGERAPWRRVAAVVLGLAAIWSAYLAIALLLTPPAVISAAGWHLWDACRIPEDRILSSRGGRAG